MALLMPLDPLGILRQRRAAAGMQQAEQASRQVVGVRAGHAVGTDHALASTDLVIRDRACGTIPVIDAHKLPARRNCKRCPTFHSYQPPCGCSRRQSLGRRTR